MGCFFGRVVKISFQSNSTVCQEGKNQCGSYTGKSNLNLASRFTQQSTLFHILAVKANCWKVKGRCQKKENVKIERKKREREIKCQSFGD